MTKKLARVGLGMLAMVIVVIVGWLIFHSEPPAIARSTVIGLNPPSTVSQNFARALDSRPLIFPSDHGSHPDFQTEWWYYTGNLVDSTGRHFGYQLTFFRRGLLPPQDAPQRQSELATSQVYFAHFALTDSANNRHIAAEKFSRGVGGLAGAASTPYKVFVENWSAVALDPQADAVRLVAQDGAISITLDLQSLKPIVKHGKDGLSAKSAAPGNASYYYSFTRLDTKGTIHNEGDTYEVTGLSWMDHEWSTSALGPTAVGWDWFALQLSDQRELMFFQVRNNDGSVDPVSGGTLVEADGETVHLLTDQVHLQVLDVWQSPISGAKYPVHWRISVPANGITLDISAQINDQENALSIVYWEGAVKMVGQSGNTSVTGAGYVELTGYSGSLNGKF